MKYQGAAMPSPISDRQESLFDAHDWPEMPRRKTKLQGYAEPPGTGPRNETCKTCTHMVTLKKHLGRAKCALRIEDWRQHPRAIETSIARLSPACGAWELSFEELVKRGPKMPKARKPRRPRRPVHLAMS